MAATDRISIATLVLVVVALACIVATLVVFLVMGQDSSSSSSGAATTGPATPASFQPSKKPVGPVGPVGPSPSGPVLPVAGAGLPTGSAVPRLTRDQVLALKRGATPQAVWAVTSTCPPCKRLMQVLDGMAAEGKLQGLPVAGVVLRDQWPDDMVPAYTPTMYKVGGGAYAEAGSGSGSPDIILAKLRAMH
jgi:thiol-disulfide isomerase/thioredoxin